MTSLKTIPATKRDSQIIVTSPYTGAERAFEKIIGAVAYGDRKEIEPKVADPAVILAGEQADGRLFIFREFQGPFDLLKKELIRLKDFYLASCFYVPGENRVLIQDLLDTDGLCRYRYRLARGRKDSPVYEVQDPQLRWPAFRDRKTIAQIQRIPDRLVEDFEAAEILADRLADEKDLLMDSPVVPGLDRILGQTVEERNRSPLYRAYICAVWLLWQASQQHRNYEPERKRKLPWTDFQRSER